MIRCEHCNIPVSEGRKALYDGLAKRTWLLCDVCYWMAQAVNTYWFVNAQAEWLKFRRSVDLEDNTAGSM